MNSESWIRKTVV